MFSAPMAGEISPDMMFLGMRRKCTQMHSDDCGWFQMGVVGCISTGKQANKVKRARNTRAGCVLQYIATNKKCRKSGGAVAVTREDYATE